MQELSEKSPQRARLEISHEPLTPDIYGITLVGELGMGSVLSLDRILKGVFEQGTYRLVINLEQTFYIASSGIGILVASTELAREKGGEIVLAGMTARVRHVFDLMGLGKMLRFAANTKDALKMLK